MCVSFSNLLKRRLYKKAWTHRGLVVYMKINRLLSLPGDFHQVDFSARSRVHYMAQRSLSLTEGFIIGKSQVFQESTCLKANVFWEICFSNQSVSFSITTIFLSNFCSFVLLESIKLHTVIIVSQCFLAVLVIYVGVGCMSGFPWGHNLRHYCINLFLHFRK